MDDEELEELSDDGELDNEQESSSIPSRGSGFRKTALGSNQPTGGAIPNALNKRNGGVPSMPKKAGSNIPPKLKSASSGSPTPNSNVAQKLKPKTLPQMLGLGRRKKKVNDDSSNPDAGTDTNQENENGIDNPLKLLRVIRRTRLIIKIVIAAVVALAILFVIVAILSIFSSGIEIGSSFSNLKNDPSTFLEEDSESYQDAKMYYESLDQSVLKYSESCGIFLDENYIHAALTYKYSLLVNTASDKSVKAIYQEMYKSVDKVASLMVKDCIVDYEEGGSFYNNLVNSSFIQDYYKDELEYMSTEKIASEIFEYAISGSALASALSGMYISDNLKVNMGTCEQPYNKRLLNEGTQYTSYVPLSEYVMGAIYGEMEGSIKAENKEFLKAFTIVTTSYALGRAKYKSGDSEIWVHNGNCWQLSCNIIEGCHYNKNLPGGYGTTFTGPETNGKYYKGPMNETQKQILSEVFEEVFGTVMLTNTGSIKRASHYSDNNLNGKYCISDCMGQNNALRDSQAGMNYKDILTKYYKDFSLSNISEDLYAENVQYEEGGYEGDVVFYKQTDYKNKFCGRSGSTISSSGCGVTSMAMILSTFVNRSITPVTTMNEAHKMGYCGAGISGTSPSYFGKASSKYNLGYHAVSKSGNTQSVVDALESGKSLVIAHMGPGTFTSGGHYIVLSKVNEKGQVYVLDPNRGRRNGWHNFNSVVVKQLKGKFHIITKR